MTTREWDIPGMKCIACGHEGVEDVALRMVSDDPDGPGTLKPVCYSCSDKYDEACREAAEDETS